MVLRDQTWSDESTEKIKIKFLNHGRYGWKYHTISVSQTKKMFSSSKLFQVHNNLFFNEVIEKYCLENVYCY